VRKAREGTWLCPRGEFGCLKLLRDLSFMHQATALGRGGREATGFDRFGLEKSVETREHNFDRFISLVNRRPGKIVFSFFDVYNFSRLIGKSAEFGSNPLILKKLEPIHSADF
jgi:hypothetical protein